MTLSMFKQKIDEMMIARQGQGSAIFVDDKTAYELWGNGRKNIQTFNGLRVIINTNLPDDSFFVR